MASAPPHKLVRPVSTAFARVIEENGTLVIAVAAFAVVMLLALRHGLVVDGWMALVSGREIAQHGLPSHDPLTVWAHGRRWVDQQWLAQLVLYELIRIGGVKLVLLSHALLGVGAIAGGAVLSRRLGGSARSAAWVCLPVFVAYYPEAAVLRPQSFGYPLFVAVLWLLVDDSRRPSRRVFLVLPLLALWGNLHGSVLLGAGLTALAGLAGLADGLRTRPRKISRHSLGLVLAPWPCLLLSPYALHLPTYYERILVGGDFSRFVTEWARTTLTPATAPVYLLVIAGMWLIGRAGSSISTFEKLAFIATGVLAFQAVRNTAWLGLTALVVLPALVDAVRAPVPAAPRRLNRLLTAAVLALVAVTAAGVVARPASWFLDGFPTAAVDAATAGAGTHGTVFAMSPYADWLLWSRPGLRGRVAFDARFELFTARDVGRLGSVQARVDGWKSVIRGYDTIVLGSGVDAGLRDALVQAKMARVVYGDRDVVVLRSSR
jgi:hypothetical protein